VPPVCQVSGFVNHDLPYFLACALSTAGRCSGLSAEALSALVRNCNLGCISVVLPLVASLAVAGRLSFAVPLRPPLALALDERVCAGGTGSRTTTAATGAATVAVTAAAGAGVAAVCKSVLSAVVQDARRI
jgi:hypothetical protein